MTTISNVAHSHPSPASARLDATFFRGLSDPTRLLILETLLAHGEMNVGSLVSALGLPQSRIATHLACLRSCGYVSAHREGRYLYYTVPDLRVRELLALARAISSEHGDALACCQIIKGFTSQVLLAQPAPSPMPQRSDSQAGVTTQDTLSFGAWLSERMRQRGLSSKELASALGVSTAAVYRWLYRGGLPVPGARPQLARALDESVEQVRQRTQVLRTPGFSPFAAWLEQQLQQRDWTRAELTRRLGLEPHATIPWFRRGTTPRRSTLGRLATLMGVALEEIPLGSVGTPSPLRQGSGQV